MDDKHREINASLRSMDKMINVIELDNAIQQEEIKDIERDLLMLERKKTEAGAPVIPGKKIQELVQKWHSDLKRSSTTEDEMKKFNNELGLSLQEFEIELRRMETGQRLEHKRMVRLYDGKMTQMQQKTSMRIEALESALLQTKIKTNREKEHLNMYIGEMESRLLSNSKSVKQMDELIVQASGRAATLRSTAEARELIGKLADMLVANKEATQDYIARIDAHGAKMAAASDRHKQLL